LNVGPFLAGLLVGVPIGALIFIAFGMLWTGPR
jgi:hypothetical protein